MAVHTFNKFENNSFSIFLQTNSRQSLETKIHYCFQRFPFLAHLRLRLTRWAYSIPNGPSSIRPSSYIIVRPFKIEYLLSLLASLVQILCVASLGWRKGCVRFGAHCIKTLVYMATESPRWLIMGKTMSPPFLGCCDPILFILAGNEDMHKTWTSLNFSQIGPLTTE